MSLIPIRIPRTTKPSLGTPIDWTNPLTQGIVAVNGGHVFETLTGKVGSMSAPDTVDQTNNNLSLTASNWAFDATSRIPNRETISFLGVLNDTSAVISTGTSTANVGFATNPTDYNKGALVFRRDYSTVYKAKINNGTTTITGSTITGNKSFVACLTAAPSDINFYINGKLEGNATVTINLSVIGCYLSTPFCHQLGVWYNRTLSPAEIASLSANPWQIYEPWITWGEAASTAIPATGHNLYTLVGGELKQFTAFKALIDGTVKDLTLYTLVGGIVKPLTTAEAINAFLREDARYILREDGTRFAREA